jgi:hypothetical protein
MACQLREYVYLYGAVTQGWNLRLSDHACVYLIMPASDAKCFQIFRET